MKSQLIGKDPDAQKDRGQEEKGMMTEGEMVGWHHWLNGQEINKNKSLFKKLRTQLATYHRQHRCDKKLSKNSKL